MHDASSVRALFVFTPTDIGADTWIHLLMLKHLGREGVELHAAVEAPGASGASPVHRAVSAVSGVHVKEARFGASLYGHSGWAKLATLPRYLPAAASLLDLAVYVRRHRIRIIHASDRPRDALVCIALSALTGAKAVIHVHVEFADWVGRGLSMAFRRADALVGVSKFVASTLVAGGFDAARIHAVLNAIEVERWDPSAPRGPGRRALGVSDDAPLILCVARIYSSKGQEQLIRALPEVKRFFPGVIAAIVGSDYPPGTDVTSGLRALASELGVGDNVLFTGQRNDVPALMAVADVFCLPSVREPFGLVFAEAMAMEKPVVGIADGGTPEVVDHEQSGLLSDAHDEVALAANLIRLLSDRELRERLGRFGRAQVLARFTADRLARDVRDLYLRLLSAR